VTPVAGRSEGFTEKILGASGDNMVMHNTAAVLSGYSVEMLPRTDTFLPHDQQCLEENLFLH
jgi:hypothetical protein